MVLSGLASSGRFVEATGSPVLSVSRWTSAPSVCGKWNTGGGVVSVRPHASKPQWLHGRILERISQLLWSFSLKIPIPIFQGTSNFLIAFWEVETFAKESCSLIGLLYIFNIPLDFAYLYHLRAAKGFSQASAVQLWDGVFISFLKKSSKFIFRILRSVPCSPSQKAKKLHTSNYHF